jgi:hypothetical protein
MELMEKDVDSLQKKRPEPKTTTYVCRRGEQGSAMRLNAEPTAEQWKRLGELGFERAREGERFVREVACPRQLRRLLVYVR